jgi:hypothetical protein
MDSVSQMAPDADDVEVPQQLVTMTPFNTLIWRVLVITPDGPVQSWPLCHKQA